MKDEGPTTHTVPAHTRTTCGLCKYHVCTGALCTRIGPGGWREYTCTHPEAWPEETDPKKAEMRGHLKTIERGRMIGRTEETPAWCPYLREPNTEVSD